MKKIALLLFTCMAILSCSNDEDDQEPIVGTYQMTDYLGMLPELPVLENGDVVWDFNSGSVDVVNNVSATYPFVKPSGIYDLDYANGKVSVDGTTYEYVINGSQLTMYEDVAADGIVMKFQKQ